MDQNNDQIIDVCDTESTGSFNYDNCIVTKHEAEESLSDTSLVENQTTKQISEDENSNEENVSLDIKEAFILMVGILNRVEKYFNQKIQRECEETTLIEDMQYIKKALINSDKKFGYDTFTDRNGTVYIKNYNTSEKTGSKSTPTFANKSVQTLQNNLNLDQVDSLTAELEKEHAEMKITRVTRLSKNIKRKNSNKSIVKMDKSPKLKKGRKRKISSPEQQGKKNIKIAKVALEDELVEKATMISKSGLNPTLPRKSKTTNKSTIQEAKSNLTVAQKRASIENGTYKRNGNARSLPGEIQTNKINGLNKLNLSMPEGSLTRSVGKRKLYSQESWLLELAKTTVEPT